MQDLVLHYCEKLVSPLGGMALMKKMLNKIGIKAHLGSVRLPFAGSNRGYQTCDIL